MLEAKLGVRSSDSAYLRIGIPFVFMSSQRAPNNESKVSKSHTKHYCHHVTRTLVPDSYALLRVDCRLCLRAFFQGSIQVPTHCLFWDTGPVIHRSFDFYRSSERCVVWLYDMPRSPYEPAAGAEFAGTV